MSRKSCFYFCVLVFSVVFSMKGFAATDYPDGYVKCGRDGDTCSFSGTRSVAFGKSGNFVYATLTGPITCSASLFPSIDLGGKKGYCSYSESGSSSSSSSSSSTSSSGSSSSGGSSSSSGGYGSTCTGGSTTTVSSTIRVESGGTFDGGCKTYNGGSQLGDGGQGENQDPIFRVGPGKIRNVYIGSNGADGIHTRNGGDVENIYWSDVGEDAMTIKSPTDGATVTATKISGFDAEDKFLQANDDATWKISNCRVNNAGKFLRQNGGKTFPLHVEVKDCYISNMKEGVFRSDSPNSTARITNSRLQNAGSTCIGAWKSCSSSGITN